jgi:hypothetical protein
MRAILTAPFTPISKNIASHRSAQGVIYADQLKQAGINIDIAMSGKMPEDFNDYDEMYVYHGNDWFGTLNMFGGVKNYGNIENVIRVSKFKGKVYSIGIEYPDYYSMLQARLEKEENPHVDWRKVNWDGMQRIQKEATVIDPNTVVTYPRISIGDSHAICMYRPKWMNISIPYKTLHGALQKRLDTLIPEGKFEHIEFYFGNIDVRHHLCRFTDPVESTKKLAESYVKQANEIAEKYSSQVTLYELLPIEDESRKLPQTGYYKGKPFSGTRQQRDDVRLLFKEELIEQCKKYDNVNVFEWVDKVTNDKGELDFMYMEKPQSVHLSREFYPHWQGREWNEKYKTTESSLQRFMF